MDAAKASKPRCYDATVDFHFSGNATGQLIAYYGQEDCGASGSYAATACAMEPSPRST